MCRPGNACGCGGGGSGFPAALAVAVLAVAAVAAFVMVHAFELAAAAGVFVSVMGWLCVRWRRRYARLPVRVLVRPRPARAPAAITAGPKAIMAGLDLPEDRPAVSPASPATAIARQPPSVVQVTVARPGERMPR